MTNGANTYLDRKRPEMRLGPGGSEHATEETVRFGAPTPFDGCACSEFYRHAGRWAYREICLFSSSGGWDIIRVRDWNERVEYSVTRA